jgi:hypothetical protein
LRQDGQFAGNLRRITGVNVRPSRMTVPDCGVSNRAIAFSSVLLPQPLLPMSTDTLAAGRAKSSESITCCCW